MRPEELRTLEESSALGSILAARPSRLARATLAVLLALVVAGLSWAALCEADNVAKARGTVRSTDELVRVQLEQGGRIIEVGARIGQRVRAGQILLRLDDSLARMELERNQRALEAKQRQIDELRELERIAEAEAVSERRNAAVAVEVAEAGVERERRLESRRLEDARALVALEETARSDANHRAERARSLAAEGILAVSELETSEKALRDCELRLASARAAIEPDETSIELATRQLRAAEESRRLVDDRARTRLQEIHLRVAFAEAERAGLEEDVKRRGREIERCELVSPIDGIVVEGRPQVSEVLDAGAVVFKVTPGGELRFDALVANSEIAGLRLGQAVRVKLDAYPYQQFGTLDGRISWIAPDAISGSEAQVPQDSFYEVRIELPARELKTGSPIELGMAGQAEIVRGTEKILSLAFRKLEDRIQQ
jgi:HlyD family type I secretion membrane fusion protein